MARLSDVNIPYHIAIEKVSDTLKDEPDITTQVPALYIVETIAREVMNQRADRINRRSTFKALVPRYFHFGRSSPPSAYQPFSYLTSMSS